MIRLVLDWPRQKNLRFQAAQQMPTVHLNKFGFSKHFLVTQ